MDSTVIQPAPGQAILNTSGGHHRDHDDHRGHRRGDDLMEHTILREQAAFARADQASHALSQSAIGAARCDVIGVVKDASCANVTATKDARGDVIASVAASTASLGAGIDRSYRDVSRELDRGFGAAALASCHTNERTSDGFARASSQLCEVGKDITGNVVHGTAKLSTELCQLGAQVSVLSRDQVVGFKDAQATAYQIHGLQQLEAAKNASAIAVQADKNAAAIQLQAQTFAAAAQLEAVKNAFAAQLEAQKNANSIESKLAECCCELKAEAAATRALVSAEHVATRGLVEANEKDKLRDQIAELRAAKCCRPRYRFSGNGGGQGQGPNGDDD